MPEPEHIVGHRVDRTLFAHSALIDVAEAALVRGRTRDPSDKSEQMTAMVMAAFAFEAYLNFLGEFLFAFWGEVERIPVRNKLNLISTHLGFQPDFGRRPYQSVLALWRFRDLLAHARTETVSEVRDGPPAEPVAYPETQWELMCTVENAQRLIEDVREATRGLHTRAGCGFGMMGHLVSQGGEVLTKRPPT